MSEVAVQGCTFKASLNDGEGTISPSSLTASSQPSNKDFAIVSESIEVEGEIIVIESDKGIYFNKITVTVASGTTVTVTSPPASATSSTGTLITPDTIDITGTADNVLDSSNNKAVQKGDKGSKELTFTFPAPQGAVVTGQYNVTVEVDSAGQTDVIAS